MGTAMAGRVAAAGHRLVVYNRTRAAADEVAQKLGAQAAATARDAARGADIVVVSLADDAAVLATYGGADGLVAGLGPDTVVADTSTVSPATVREMGALVRGTAAALVDTPVSGSVPSVEAGTLMVMAGGADADIERARPALESFAERILLVGPLGSGATMKLAVNAMVFGLNGTLAEALVLAERSGVDRALAYEVFASSVVAAPFVHYKRTAYERPGEVPVAFALDLVAKDLDLAAGLAAEVGADVPQLVANRHVVGEAIAAGLGQEDMSALAAHLRASAGRAEA
jgi:3-hydroxyisobutyrate dehydrogenase-like beta-hydroxyacid dehydrogenase